MMATRRFSKRPHPIRPFSGLGFDLSRPGELAGRLRIRGPNVTAGRLEKREKGAVVALSGYALHIRLGRETRAG